MGILIDAARESLNPLIIIKWIKYKYDFYKNNPDWFGPSGLVCFVGEQGSGKTLSAVNYVYKLMQKYPKCKLVTNIMLKDYPIVTYDMYKQDNISIYKDLISKMSEYQAEKIMHGMYIKNNRVFEFKNNDDLKKYSNGKKGVIYLIDEIHLYMNSLESKNINIDVMTQISQQRKQRKHIVATCQIFGRMAKPLREQFSSVMICKNYLGFIQFNRMIDRDSIDSDNSSDTNLKGKVKKRFMWLHNPIFYNRYDTYSIISKNKFVDGENQIKGGIYDANSKLSVNN